MKSTWRSFGTLPGFRISSYPPKVPTELILQQPFPKNTYRNTSSDEKFQMLWMYL